MGKFSRDKGRKGESEVVNLIHGFTGWEVKRRVRNLQGDSDIDVQGTPLDAWCIEVKRYAKATRGSIGEWWDQAVEESKRFDLRPVLLYRANFDEWRAVWSPEGSGGSYAWTRETSLPAWLDGVRGGQL